MEQLVGVDVERERHSTPRARPRIGHGGVEQASMTPMHAVEHTESARTAGKRGMRALSLVDEHDISHE